MPSDECFYLDPDSADKYLPLQFSLYGYLVCSVYDFV